MNSTSSHPPSTKRPSAQHAAALDLIRERAPRTRLADRIAMRIGLALLIWGTRPEPAAAPRVDGFRADPRVGLHARHAADESLARHALLHGGPPHHGIR